MNKRLLWLQDMAERHLVMDPDYLVSVLEITTEELIKAFPDKFIEYVDREFEDVEIEERDYDGPDIEEIG